MFEVNSVFCRVFIPESMAEGFSAEVVVAKECRYMDDVMDGVMHLMNFVA